LRLGWIRMTRPQKEHFALPSCATSAWVDRPQSRHLHVRKELMTTRVSRRRPATGGHEKLTGAVGGIGGSKHTTGVVGRPRRARV
jgi:hypothetical protein